ncbi:MAG: phenylalanine--tRNA ligase subunit alpha, partial [Clostridia bacterium]|nr:phenylalanine--tRNA ligase subunit alpha [Clostridia bacterium]
MKERISEIHAKMVQELSEAKSRQSLEDVRVRILGKKGELTALLRSMGQLAPEERPAAGQMINEAREKLTAQLEEKIQEF